MTKSVHAQPGDLAVRRRDGFIVLMLRRTGSGWYAAGISDSARSGGNTNRVSLSDRHLDEKWKVVPAAEAARILLAEGDELCDLDGARAAARAWTDYVNSDRFRVGEPVPDDVEAAISGRKNKSPGQMP